MPLTTYKSEFAEKSNHAMLQDLRNFDIGDNQWPLTMVGEAWEAHCLCVVLPPEVGQSMVSETSKSLEEDSGLALKTQDAGASRTWVDTQSILAERGEEEAIVNGSLA